jgi:saccharopine dehydrogenase-like NADP-dependent oxidoreductase
MGPAAAFGAISDPAVTQVTLCDLDERQLGKARKKLAPAVGGGKFSTHRLDVTDGAAAARLMADYDAIVTALPQAASAAAIRAAASAGVPAVDLTRPPEAQIAALRKDVQSAGTLAILGCGVDPGLTEIMTRFLTEKLDRVGEIHIRCGGFPEKPTPPLGYKIVFGGRQLPLREEDALVVEAGELKPVPRYSGAEMLVFAGVGECEAYHEGFAPWLLELPSLKGLGLGTQKTVRWPGFAAKATLLKELGLLGQEPVTVDGCKVAPKRFLDLLLEPRVRLEENEPDIVVFRVEASGLKNDRPHRYRVQMTDRYDERNGFTAMARVTAFTAAIVARMAARGELNAKGLLTPEQVIAGAHFHRLLAELAASGILFELRAEETGPLF